MKTNREIIESFEWLDAEIDLPVDPDDPDQVARACRWAKREYDRYDGEYRLALGMPHLWPAEAAAIYRRDRDSVGEFYAALALTFHDMRQRDQERLEAWNNGDLIVPAERLSP
jgi:hypothetical protein